MSLMDFINNLTPGQLAAIGQLGSSISALGRPYMDPTEPGRAFQQGLAGIPAAVQQADLAALQQRGLEGQIARQESEAEKMQALLEAIMRGGGTAGGPAGGRTGFDPFIENLGRGTGGPAGILPGEGEISGMDKLIASAYPELFAEQYLGQRFGAPAAPELATDVEGYQRFVTGPRAGQRAFPEAKADPTKTMTGAEKEAYKMYGDLEDPRAKAYVRESRLGKADTEIKQSDINALANAYRKDTSEFKAALAGLEKVRNAAELKTGVGDVALIFGLMKVIDPRSTVREGEQATVEQAGGARRYLNLYNRAVQGQRLTKEQRDEIVVATESQFRPYVRSYIDTERYYAERARRHGFDVRDIVRDEFGDLRGQFTDVPPIRELLPRLRYNPVTRQLE